MRKNSFAILATILAFIMAIPTATVWGQPATDTRTITPTESVIEIALSDFDYLAEIILDNLPTRGVLGRRFQGGLEGILDDIRLSIASGQTQTAWTSVFWGRNWAEAPVDEVAIAADYLASILLETFRLRLNSFAHMGPLSPGEFERILTLMLIVDYIAENEIDLGVDMRTAIATVNSTLETFLSPASLHIYGVYLQDIDETNIDLLTASGVPARTGNITTEIISQDSIAYVGIGSFMSDPATDGKILSEFFEEVQDFEHLIIDIRGNGGGLATIIFHNIVGGLIDQPLDFSFTEFFTDGQLARQVLSQSGYTHMAFPATTQGLIPVAEYIKTNNLTEFEPDDLYYIKYALPWNFTIEPHQNSTPFAGDIWLLVNGRSASASEVFALLSLNTGFATVVGQPTRGVTGVTMLHVSLPQTGLVFRLDIASLIDPLGRSFEEFGIIPQIPNIEGLDAKETVLYIISN